jgi:hypothetical protein
MRRKNNEAEEQCDGRTMLGGMLGGVFGYGSWVFLIRRLIPKIESNFSILNLRTSYIRRHVLFFAYRIFLESLIACQ